MDHRMREHRQKLVYCGWPIKRVPRISLPLFILLAALLHISTIFLFNIVYQAPTIHKPIAAQVLFLLPGSLASSQLAPWLEANDPAIFSPIKTVTAFRKKIDPAIYQSISALPLPLQSLPIEEKQPIQPPLPSGGEMFSLKETSQNQNLLPQETVSTVSAKTTLQLLDGLAERMPKEPLGFPAYTATEEIALPPTKLTVNIDTEGIPRHVIVLQSCGNFDADDAASRWVMSSRFAPADHETWGTLIVIWGKNSSSI